MPILHPFYGITSDQLTTSNYNSNGSAHLKTWFSSTKRRKLIDDLNEEKIQNEKELGTNDKQWLQLDSEYEVAIITSGTSNMGFTGQKQSCSKSSKVLSSVNAGNGTLLISKRGVSEVKFGSDAIIPLRGETVLENDFVMDNKNDFVNTQEGNSDSARNDTTRTLPHDLGDLST